MSETVDYRRKMTQAAYYVVVSHGDRTETFEDMVGRCIILANNLIEPDDDDDTGHAAMSRARLKARIADDSRTYVRAMIDRRVADARKDLIAAEKRLLDLQMRT